MGGRRYFSKVSQIVGIVLATAIASGCQSDGDRKTEEPEEVRSPETQSDIRFGFDFNQFRVVQDTVQDRWTLSHVLLPHGLSQAEINRLDNQCRDSCVEMGFIKPGQCFTMLYDPADTARARYCIFELDKTDYVVFDFGGELSVYRQQLPFDIVRKRTGGVIEGSMWQTFVDTGLGPLMAARVVNIYQWSIDFFRIQKGDWFRVVYDEKQVNGATVGYGQIYALELNTGDSSFFAISFPIDSATEFYDDKGQSLKKALLKAPLDYIRVSSGFSHSRMHPILGYATPHLGVDYAAPAGTPIVSVGDGEILYAGWAGGAGNYIKIRHANNIETQYMHLLNYADGIKKGARVKQGQKLGEVGSTGLSTGPHLDYRITIDGKPVDPLSAEIPTQEPLPAEKMSAFVPRKDSLIQELLSIRIKGK
jgi:murein DD-endopeptidase MepM/ murein hydrolase activator NlpD